MKTKKTSSKTVPLFFQFSYDFINNYAAGNGDGSPEGRNDNTVISYKTALSSFANYIESRGFAIESFYFDSIDRDFMLQYIRYLKGKKPDGTPDPERKGLSASSINTKMAALKSYAGFALDQDPTLLTFCRAIKGISRLKEEEKVKELLTDKQVEEIIKEIPNTWRGRRDRNMLLLLYESGCRVSELVNLKTADVSTEADREHIRVFGKGKKQRVIPISKNMGEALAQYKSQFHGGPSVGVSEYLFYTIIKDNAAPITVRSVQLILAKYAAKARAKDPSIPEKVHPHMMRRSRATALYRDGMPFEMVSGVLGHESLDTTKVYAKPDLRTIRDRMSETLIGQQDQEPDWKQQKNFTRIAFGLNPISEKKEKAEK